MALCWAIELLSLLAGHCTLDTQADTTRIFHFGILEQFWGLQGSSQRVIRWVMCFQMSWALIFIHKPLQNSSRAAQNG